MGAEQVFELASRGGAVIWVLLVFSLVALAIVVLKLYQFAQLRIWSDGGIEAAIAAARAGDRPAALGLARAGTGPVARIVAVALKEQMGGQLHGDALREEVERVGEAELSALESNLRGLEVIGTLAPLLGLLGTVLGMIRAFMRLEEAGARVDPALLSGGIWEALLTTAVGLTVAIPATAALAWLEAQVDRVRRSLGDAATRVLAAGRDDAEPGPAEARLRGAESARAL